MTDRFSEETVRLGSRTSIRLLSCLYNIYNILAQLIDRRLYFRDWQNVCLRDNVVIGKLKLKGKALNVKGGIKKKKKVLETRSDDTGGSESRYLEQAERLQAQRLAQMAKKSHRDRVQEFNQYLANLSEHYDIPKVGPG
ncbi:uncharacterized protein LOC133738025 [Rosa rugosa]|uniref:uncharacterized protein LOC133738025 n=1 Tax=Rosa rugosa TaxID=74645 RepID=UPI002B40B182|nr:uncharacterized protein LOC133738025 [Rosa rugosa]